MRIHFLYAVTATHRILYHAHKIKFLPSNFPIFTNQVFHQCNQHILRIICTDSCLQSWNFAMQETVKKQPLDSQVNFLKENFDITVSPYMKLVLPEKSCNLDDVLITNEFKYVLSRFPSSYDINIHEKFAVSLYYPSSLSPIYECNSQLIAAESGLLNQDNFDQCSKVYIESHENKDTVDGKPTEEQLLLIGDKLTYSLNNFFEQSQDFSIYHKNIVFQNNIKGVTIRGLNAYIQSMYLLKLYGRLHFAGVKVEILKVTHHVEDGTIRVRWRVNGLPRHKLVLMLLSYRTMDWKKMPEIETQWLDGFSVYSVDKDALIYKHLCDKMIPDDDALLAKKVDFKSRLLGLLGLAPRGPAAGTLNALFPCLKAPATLSNKKFT